MNWIDDIKNYVPYNEQEKKDKELILNAISNYNNILDRECSIAHITSSGYIVNKSRTKVLMIYHKLYNSWAWTGGHADGDCDLLHVAIKEAKEETGLNDIKVLDENIITLDILPVVPHVKRGKFVSGHLHFCISYSLMADETSETRVKLDENTGVKWIKIDELEKYSNEPYLIGIYRKIHKRVVSKFGK